MNKKRFTFRAWVGGRMVHFDLGDDMPANWVGWDTVMQNTALTDKNGKEIYEGDVVSVQWHPMDHPERNVVGQTQLIGEFIGFIEYNPLLGIRLIPGMYAEPTQVEVNSISASRPPRKQEDGWQMIVPSLLKDFRINIIGNIYENPELLTK